MRRLFGLVLIIVALVWGFVIVNYQSGASPFAAANIPTCLSGPYPNPPIPVGSTLGTSAGLVGYFQGSTFVPYNGYLAGLQIVNGQAYPCTVPSSTTSTTSQNTMIPASSSTTSVLPQSSSPTITVTFSTTTSVIGSSTMTTSNLYACSNNCPSVPNLGLLTALGIGIVGAILIVPPEKRRAR